MGTPVAEYYLYKGSKINESALYDLWHDDEPKPDGRLSLPYGRGNREYVLFLDCLVEMFFSFQDTCMPVKFVVGCSTPERTRDSIETRS